MPDPIFSRKRRGLKRARAHASPPDSHWLLDRMAEDLVDRLSFMTLDIGRALVIGHGADVLRPALPPGAHLVRCDLAYQTAVHVVAEEDRLPFADGQFDLVVACGTLDSIDDLPGALLLIRRTLRPGGLFLGAMLGAGSLSQFRRAVQQAEEETSGHAALRFHPQIEVRAAGDLLFRAGFSIPVADQDEVPVRYHSVAQLLADLRGMGASNALRETRPFSRAAYEKVKALANDAAFEERFAPIYMTGWAPVAGEVRPTGPVKGFL